MKSRVSSEALQSGRRRTGKAAPRGSVGAGEQGFRRLFEAARDGILVLDLATRKILEANPLMLALLGRSRQEVLDKELTEVGILNTEEAKRKMFDVLERSGFVRFEHALPNATAGQPKELEFVCSLYDDNGKSLIQCIVRDIADRKQSEKRLREAMQELASAKEALENRIQERTADLQQRNAELEAFSYSLSHDLRAPIRAIVSFTQIALDDYSSKLGPHGVELLDRAISAAQRLDHLIFDVLAFSKTTRHRVKRENVDVQALLQEILRERPEWAPPKAEIRIRGPLLQVRGDRASVTQCLTNLLDNAVKFAAPGTKPMVQVYSERVGSKVRLYVEDNGLGIPVDAQSRVFDLFERAHNGYEGHGIGLAIVRRAAERMGGTVGLSSEPAKGSKFWIELPEPQ